MGHTDIRGRVVNAFRVETTRPLFTVGYLSIAYRRLLIHSQHMYQDVPPAVEKN